MRGRTAFLALVLTLLLVGCQAPAGPRLTSPTPTNHCAEPAVETLDTEWRFQTDPGDRGVSEQWYRTDLDDANWTRLAPGEPWESSGVEYDGVAWYRTTFSMPAWPAVYVGFGQVDDAATLWLNGERQMSWHMGDEQGEAQAVDVTPFGEAGDEVVLALRIEDHGGYGGVKGPVRLSDEPRGVMRDAEYIRWLADAHEDWPMPDWLDRAPIAWTMTGLPQAAEEALVRSDGALAPWAQAPTTELWLYDSAAGELITGTQKAVNFSLHEGYLPFPKWEWEGSGVLMQNVLFGDVEGGTIRWQVSVTNESWSRRDLALLVVVRPFGIDRSMAPICSISLQGETQLRIDGRPFLVAGSPPMVGGVGSLDAVMDAAARGQAPSDSVSFKDGSGLGSAALVYPLSFEEADTETFEFAFPADPGARTIPPVEGDTAQRLADTAAGWERALGRARFDLPDQLVENGVRASTGYLLLALDPDGPHPGPLAHDAMWVRDAAYIGLALLQMGQADAVRDYVPDVLSSLESNGRVPPIQGDEIPWHDEEWDAQGQLIFLITRYYRYTGEMTALEAWYPAARSAARFIVDLRATNRDTGGPARGLLPPSKSAEDLGPSNQHYYWDDLWAVVGLEEAAYAARELGIPEDAEWMEAEADALRGALLRSVEDVMGPVPAYIPAAVEESESSAMARGTVPALWPMAVLSPDSPLVQRSFDVYYDRWIGPDSGGFRHRRDQYWPYGGLELAHAYLRLGRPDVTHEILGWSLDHETLPGTFAWAEQMDPHGGGISGGDMPHAWAAASYATLVREMLITEAEGALELFNGIPDWWLEAESVIELGSVPTHFGPLDLTTGSTIRQTETGWDGVLTLSVSGAAPPQGYRWQPPVMPAAVDGPAGVELVDGRLLIPAAGGTVRLRFSSQ